MVMKTGIAWVALATACVFGCGTESGSATTGESGSSSESETNPSGPESSGDSSDSADTTTGGTSAGTVSTTAETSDTEDSGGGSTTGAQLGDKVEIRIDNFEIPSAETYYACFEFSFQLDQLAHITRFTPFIDNGAYVHHFVLTTVDEPSGNPPGFSCYSLDGDTLWAWAPGQTDFTLPEEAGFLVGNAPDGRAHLRLQVHYNNPQNTVGQVDSSGFDMWVTTDLRPHTAGSLTVADIAGFTIPPGDSAYDHVTTCSSSVTSAMFEEPINVFGSMLHAHEIGSVLWTEVWRDGAMAYELNREEPFDFENQTIREIDRVIRPGDEIRNHCVYDSTGRSEPTQGGPGTLDEMCWNSLTYYPKIPSGFDFCSSAN